MPTGCTSRLCWRQGVALLLRCLLNHFYPILVAVTGRSQNVLVRVSSPPCALTALSLPSPSSYLYSSQNQFSAFGAFLDPVADKLMVAAVLILLCTQPIPAGPLQGNTWLLPCATLGKRCLVCLHNCASHLCHCLLLALFTKEHVDIRGMKVC